ncbi:transporter, partial [Aquabacterium soli]
MHTPPAKSRTLLGRTPTEWLSSLPVFTLLLLTLIIGTGEMVHGQLLKFGESMFGDQKAQVQYFMLRGEVSKPTCTPTTDIDAEVQRQMSAPATNDDIDNLFGETQKDPEALRRSLEESNKICQFKQDMYNRIQAHQTPQVK